MKPLVCGMVALVSCAGSFALGQVQPKPTSPGWAQLSWQPGPGTNVIINYNVYYGSGSRAYTNVQPAGTALTFTVTNLVRGVTYYFAATACDNLGQESDYSTEVTWTPALPPGAPTQLKIISGN